VYPIYAADVCGVKRGGRYRKRVGGAEGIDRQRETEERKNC
jgi:hypothetical protein